LVEGPLGHRVADGTRLLDHGDFEVGLDPAGLLHDRVAVDQLDVGQVGPQGVDE
jgi:hypothetical protein